MTSGPRTAFELWRERGEGFSPLLSEPLLERALGHLEPALTPGAIVLDLGSGPGHIAALLAARGAHALALDIDVAMLRAGAARHPGPVRVAGDQARLPVRSGSVDALFSFSTLQYADRTAVIAECRRVLRPGGRVAIVENLAGNTFARAARWLHAVTGTPYGAHLTPRRHLPWAEREAYARAFRDVRCEPFHVLTPMLLAWPSLAREPVARERDSGLRALYATLHRWDRSLVQRWPSAAWCVVICGVR